MTTADTKPAKKLLDGPALYDLLQGSSLTVIRIAERIAEISPVLSALESERKGNKSMSKPVEGLNDQLLYWLDMLGADGIDLGPVAVERITGVTVSISRDKLMELNVDPDIINAAEVRTPWESVKTVLKKVKG